jgi:hypothetical protein
MRGGNEPDYLTVAETALMLRVSGDTAIHRFASEPDVFVLGNKETVRGRRKYRMLRIPMSVVRKYINRRSS